MTDREKKVRNSATQCRGRKTTENTEKSTSSRPRCDETFAVGLNCR
jgi:hypothetical protein